MTKRPLILLSIPLVAAGVLAGCGDDSSPGDEPRKVTVIGAGEVTGVPDGDGIGRYRGRGRRCVDGPQRGQHQDHGRHRRRRQGGREEEDVQTQQVSLSPRATPGPVPVRPPASAATPPPTPSPSRSATSAPPPKRRPRRSTPAATTPASTASACPSMTTPNCSSRPTRAFTDARTRAEQYASLSGDTLGPVLSIDEQVSGAATARPTPARAPSTQPSPSPPASRRSRSPSRCRSPSSSPKPDRVRSGAQDRGELLGRGRRPEHLDGDVIGAGRQVLVDLHLHAGHVTVRHQSVDERVAAAVGDIGVGVAEPAQVVGVVTQL